MKTPLDLFIEAQNNQLKVVAGHRVALLKSQDELQEFRGKDDYEIAVAAIVTAYPKGIVVTRLREVLPDSTILDKAIKKLVDEKQIASEPYGKRSQLLKPLKQEATQPSRPEVVEVNTNPTGDLRGEPVEPASTETQKTVAAK